MAKKKVTRTRKNASKGRRRAALPDDGFRSLVEKLTLAAREKFPDDTTRPGIVISDIRTPGDSAAMYYVSVTRYPRGTVSVDPGTQHAVSRVSVAKSIDPDLHKAMLDVAEQLTPTPNKLQLDLARALKALKEGRTDG
jgi:hypothetical protein